MKTKTDLYTKFILTVIAIFLGILVFQNTTVIEKATASPLPMPNRTDSEVIKVDIVKVDGRSVWRYVPVEIKD